MSEDLQQLLNRIKSEGVEKARGEADAIIAKAREEAASIVSEAEEKAKSLRADAERDAESFRKRSEESIGQTLRDKKIQLAGDLQSMVENLLRAEVRKALSDKATVADLVAKAVAAYATAGEREMQVELGAASAGLAAQLLEKLRGSAAGKGVDVADGKAFPNGFRIRMAGGRVEQCFDEDSIVDAMARSLRPQLAEILRGGRK